MSNTIHPAAPHILPAFITAPGESDVFLIGSGIFLILVLFALGTLYFRLHALPEHLAHGNASKLQFEVVAVLALLGLLTHTTAFWIAALLLALVPIPDLYGPLTGMADSLARIAGWRRSPPAPAYAAPERGPDVATLDPTPEARVGAPEQPAATDTGERR